MIRKNQFLSIWNKQECLCLAIEASSRTHHFWGQEQLMAEDKVPSLETRIATIIQPSKHAPNLKTQFHNNRWPSVSHKLPRSASEFRKLMSLKQHQRWFNQYNSPLHRFFPCLKILQHTMTLPTRRLKSTWPNLLVFTRKLIVIAAIIIAIKLRMILIMFCSIRRPATRFTMDV